MDLNKILCFLIIFELNHIFVMSDIIQEDAEIELLERKEINYSEGYVLKMLNKIYKLNGNRSMAEKYEVAEYFWLYTRKNSYPIFMRTGAVDGVNNLYFDFTKKTFMIIHGWLGDGGESSVQDLKNAFLNKMDVNVIVLNWERAAYNMYPIARWNIIGVSREACYFLKSFIDYPLDQVHIVGHSLGAHLAGLIGKCVGQRRLGSIVGLDPANPLFSFTDPDRRLSQSDAKYVEVIHTNAGIFGFLLPIGDVDFYVNGGTKQPICPSSEIALCPHMRAYNIYIDTIATVDRYVGLKCSVLIDARLGNCWNSNVRLSLGGYSTKTFSSGIYWVSTI